MNSPKTDGNRPADDARRELRRLASLGCDEALSESDMAALEQLLSSAPEMVADYAAFVANESLIEQSCGLAVHDGGESTPQLPSAPAATTAVLRPTTVAGRRPPRNSSTRWMLAVAAGALIAVTATLSTLVKRPLATVIAAADARVDGGEELHAGQPLGESWIDLESGSVRVKLREGAMVQFEAPVRFRPLPGNAAELERGAARAFVAEAASGFRLRCPLGDVVDLGTAFRVVSQEEGPLSVHVTQGSVRLEPSEAGEFLIEAGQLARVRPGGQPSVASADRVRVRGQFRFVQEHPESLGLDAYDHDDEAFVFLESHAVTLPYDLRVDVAATGRHGVFTNQQTVLAAGTVVDCYLVHCAPQRERQLVEGRIRFGGEILGLLCNDDRLNATNDLLGAGWTLTCQHPERGAESAPDPNSDVLSISSDRRRFSATFRTMSIDQVRVLVAHDPI